MKNLRDTFGGRFLFRTVFLCIAVLCSALSADEIDKLIEETEARANYLSHSVSFSAKEEDFVFDSKDGKITLKLWAIKDRENYVAIWHAQESKLYVVAANPSTAGKEIKMPITYNAGTNSFDGRLGVRIAMFPYCYGTTQTADKSKYSFSRGWDTLKLTVTSTWIREHNAEAVYEFTFGCDPVFGYVVDMDVQFKTSEESNERVNPFGTEMVNLYPGHTNTAEMENAVWRYEYTVYTPSNSEKYAGRINDFLGSDQAEIVQLRSGGFSTFLYDLEEQGPALVCTTGEGRSITGPKCKLNYDLSYYAPLSKQRDMNGYFNVRAKYRLVFLPPEISSYILETAEISDQESDGAFSIRIGETEGFETESQSISTEHSTVYSDLELSEDKTYSGDKSLAIDGDVRYRIDVKPVPEPNATYMVEAWVRVFKGESNKTEAYILAEPSRWIPKGVKLEPYQSESVKDDLIWKKITLEFKNGPIGATYRLYIVVNGGCEKVYVDEVLIRQVGSDNFMFNETQ